jgi:hypothetical protein
LPRAALFALSGSAAAFDSVFQQRIAIAAQLHLAGNAHGHELDRTNAEVGEIVAGESYHRRDLHE